MGQDEGEQETSGVGEAMEVQEAGGVAVKEEEAADQRLEADAEAITKLEESKEPEKETNGESLGTHAEAPQEGGQVEKEHSSSPALGAGETLTGTIEVDRTASQDTKVASEDQQRSEGQDQTQDQTQAEEDEDGKGDEDDNNDRMPGTNQGGAARGFGRRARYKFVCTPPEGYIPSELDAKTLPKSYFLDPQTEFTLKAKASHRRQADQVQAGRTQGLGNTANQETDGQAAVQSGVAATFRPIAQPRQGPIGSHVTDALVMSRRVGYDLEGTGDVISLPFNCQPPKKRFRNNYGYVTGPQHFYEVRNLEPSPPSPNPLLYAAYR